MPKRPLLPIDPDLWAASEEYVHKQLATMSKFECAPILTTVECDDLIYKCAVYPQQLRNLTLKNAIQRERKAKRVARGLARVTKPFVRTTWD